MVSDLDRQTATHFHKFSDLSGFKDNINNKMLKAVSMCSLPPLNNQIQNRALIYWGIYVFVYLQWDFLLFCLVEFSFPVRFSFSSVISEHFQFFVFFSCFFSIHCKSVFRFSIQWVFASNTLAHHLSIRYLRLHLVTAISNIYTKFFMHHCHYHCVVS